MYWAEALSNSDNSDLKSKFSTVFEDLKANETKILEELINAQGNAVNIGGYYEPNEDLTDKAMRPSITLNTIIDSI